MAWIESHQSLAQHPKTKRLARALGVSLPTTIGYLHLLWWWTLDYAEDGELKRYTPEDIADACQWDGDTAMLWNGLVSAGFIDAGEGKACIHDWDDYAGKLVERRRRNRDYMRAVRVRHVDTTLSHVEGYPTNPTEPTQQNSTLPTEPEKSTPVWLPPDWFLPLTKLSGYKVKNHERAARGIEAACIESGADVTLVVAEFAKHWATLKIKYSNWHDPVAVLKGKPLEIAIEQSKGGTYTNGRGRGQLPAPSEYATVGQFHHWH